MHFLLQQQKNSVHVLTLGQTETNSFFLKPHFSNIQHNVS